MSSIIILLILLLSLSISACDGRHLNTHVKDSNEWYHQYSSKAVAKVKLDETSVSEKATDQSSSPGDHSCMKVPVNGVEIAVENQGSATVANPEGSKALTKESEGKKEKPSGSQVLMPYSHGGLRRTAPLEVRSGRRVRSVLGYEFNEETLGTNTKGTVVMTDLAAMDYPGAGQGPSTHNR